MRPVRLPGRGRERPCMLTHTHPSGAYPGDTLTLPPPNAGKRWAQQPDPNPASSAPQRPSSHLA